jgi:hypothetical protein
MTITGLITLAGIVAKGLGVLAALIGGGFILGVILTLMVTARFRRGRRRG